MQLVSIRSRQISRDRLLELFEGGPRWVFVRAPEGYDKIAAVQAWLHANPRRAKSARWIEVGASDRVDAASVTLLLSQESLLKVLVLDATRLTHALDSATLRELGTRAHQVIVIARSERIVPDHLAALLEARVLDAEALAYRAAEIAARIPNLDETRVRRIRDATWGWPMLVRLVEPHEPYTSLQLSRLAASFVEERLTHLTPRAKTVMQATCVVSAPSLALTAELAGLTDADSRAAWEEIAAEGLAVETTVGHEPAWRRVPLVWEAHLAHCTEEDQERIRDLHQRAARWFAQYSWPVAAARHAIAAEDWVTALEVIEEAAYTLLAEHPVDARELVNSIPSNIVDNYPVARVLHDMFSTLGDNEAQFTAATSAHRPHSPIFTTEELENMLHQSDSDEDVLELAWRKALHLRVEGDFVGAAELHDRLHAPFADRSRVLRSATRTFLPVLHLQSGISSLLAGRFADAEQDLTMATSNSKAGFGAFAQRDAFSKLALIAGIHGDIPRAQENLTQMKASPRVIGFWARTVRFGEKVAEALVATQRLDVDAAHAALDIAQQSAGRDEFWAFYLFARARLAVVEGSTVAALTELSALRRTRAHLAGPGSAASLILSAAEAELLLAVDRPAQAEVSLIDAPSHPLLTGIRALQKLQLGAPAEVIALTGAVLWTAEAGPSARAVGFLARAAAELQLNQLDDAAMSFRFAHKLINRFEQRCLLGVLSRDTITQLTKLTGLDVDLDSIPAMLPTPLPFVALTERELLVLEHLTTGHTIGAIARTLFVSENTVRSQLRAVYRKLGVNSRDDAVAEARRRGIAH